jgi:hypothetical protein
VALFSLTVNSQSPALERRASELAFIARALALAVQDVRAAGGAKTSGNILNDGAVVIGNWVYSPAAGS